MPKVKELGVTVVPEGFGPVGIGFGGGCAGWTYGCYRTMICTDCTTQPYSICGTTPGPQQQWGGCTDCTTQAFSICGTSPGPQQCTDCTTQAFSICGTSPGPQQCTDCTTQPFSICGTTPGPRQQQALTPESIRQLRTQLQQQLAALDEAEKQLGPKTEAEIEAREKEIQSELESLRARRDELKSKG